MATNPQARMTRLTARIDAAALAAFDAYAEGRGGRSAVLRQLIAQAAKANGDVPHIEPPDGAASNRISLRFTDTELAVITHRASQRSTDRSRWIKALVRRHIGLKGRVDDGLLAELAPIRMQLLRIGRNLNQAMKAANAAMLESGDKQIESELHRIADMRMEISEQLTAVGEAMRGGFELLDGRGLMGLESALWEATRPAFRVRYIHDPEAVPRPPLYASFGIADAKTARAKLARIVRGAPEVVVKVTGRQKGGSHVTANLDYIGRKGEIDIETRDGELLTSKEDIAERAEEWSDTLQWRSRPTVSSVSMIFSMPEGTDPEKVLGAVRALAHSELSDNHDYVLALHTETPRPHVHLTVQAEGLDRTRFNPRPVQLNRFRERFARELRDRGVAAEATPRRARGHGVAGSSMALVKLRAQFRSEGSRQIADADRRTNEQAIAVARGQEVLPAFIAIGNRRWDEIRDAYGQTAAALDATGNAEDRRLAQDVRGFLDKHEKMNATPEVFAARHAQILLAERQKRDLPTPDRPSPDRGRSR